MINEAVKNVRIPEAVKTDVRCAGACGAGNVLTVLTVPF